MRGRGGAEAQELAPAEPREPAKRNSRSSLVVTNKAFDLSQALVQLLGKTAEQTLEVLFAVPGLGTAGQPGAHELRCGGAEYEPGPGVVFPRQAIGMIADYDGVLGCRDDTVGQRGDRAGPPPDRTRWEGWQQWRKIRDTFVPAPRLTPADYQSLSPRRRALHDLHRTATHVNMRLQETPMSARVANLMRGRLQNNAVKFMPGNRDGLMINGGGFQGKTETACDAAASFEDVWREVHHQLLPGPTPGTRDVFVPVAYCRLPVRATPKGLCKAILNVYGNPHPGTLDDLVRAVRDAIRDHHTPPC